MTRHRFERPAGPSSAVGDSEEFRYSEKEEERPSDIMPESDPEFTPGDGRGPEPAGRAALRLRIEALLQRREPAPVEQWQALGPEGLDILVDLLDDPELGQPLRHSVIATLGQIGPPELAERLGPLLLDETETPLTRTYAASALGRLGGEQAAVWLARAIGDPDEMVRLQLARGLGRISGPPAAAALRSLADDRAAVVAETAARALESADWAPPAREGAPGAPGADRPVPEDEEKAQAGPGGTGRLWLLIVLLVLILGCAAWWLLSRTPA